MAPYKRRNRKVRKSGKRVARKSYARKGRSAASVKAIVRKEIARNIENKTFQYLGTAHDILPSNSVSYDTNIIPCYPSAGYLAINQGSGQGQRSANLIKIKKLKIDGIIFPRAYDPVSNLTPCPVHIKVWFFYDKEEPNAISAPAAAADFFQFGNTAIGFQNELFDHTMPVNTDRYRVLTSRILKVGFSSYLGTGAQPQQGNFANNDYKLNARLRVDLTKYCVKRCNFRDNNANPTTRGIYMMAQAVYANGNPMTAGTIPARMEYMLTVDYEDA